MPRSQQFTLLCCVAVLLALGGCKEAGSSVTYKVRGTVKLNGEPVKDMKIVFTPANGRPADGNIDSSGHFKFLTTDKVGDGAVEGKHKVSLAMITPATMPDTPPGRSYASKPYSGYPKKYSSVETTDVEVTVSSSGENNLEIVLNDKEPAPDSVKTETPTPKNAMGPEKASDAESQ